MVFSNRASARRCVADQPSTNHAHAVEPSSCQNTMRAMKIKSEDLFPFATEVDSGVAELVLSRPMRRTTWLGAEILAMLVFALVLLIFFRNQPFDVLFQTAGTEASAGGALSPVFLVAMFMALFVVYGFDTAGTFGEETLDAGRQAPRGVLSAILLSGVIGAIFLLAGGGFCVVFGLGALNAGTLGAQSRYVAGETLPTVKQSAAYLTDGEGILGVGRTVDDARPAGSAAGSPAAAPTAGPYCRACGTRNDQEARFCDSCGASLA